MLVAVKNSITRNFLFPSLISPSKNAAMKHIPLSLSPNLSSMVPENEGRIHVIKRSDGWVLKKDGAERASRKYPTKEEAIDSARLYRLKGYDVVVHRADGSVEKWSKSGR